MADQGADAKAKEEAAAKAKAAVAAEATKVAEEQVATAEAAKADAEASAKTQAEAEVVRNLAEAETAGFMTRAQAEAALAVDPRGWKGVIPFKLRAKDVEHLTTASDGSRVRISAGEVVELTLSQFNAFKDKVQ